MIQAARTTNKITAVILLMGLIGFGVTQHFGVIAQTTTVTTSTPSIVIDSTSDINSITPVDGSIVIIRTGAGSGVFSYDKDSSSTADGTDVINGPNSIGRLLKISGGSAVDSSNVLVVDNVAAFATTSSTDGKLFITRGYSTAGIGSGIYRYHATGRPTADGVLYFDAAGADDYLELLHNGVIDVTQAGATESGNQRDKVQAVIDSLYLAGGGTVTVSIDCEIAGSTSLFLYGPVSLRGIGGGRLSIKSDLTGDAGAQLINCGIAAKGETRTEVHKWTGSIENLRFYGSEDAGIDFLIFLCQFQSAAIRHCVFDFSELSGDDGDSEEIRKMVQGGNNNNWMAGDGNDHRVDFDFSHNTVRLHNAESGGESFGCNFGKNIRVCDNYFYGGGDDVVGALGIDNLTVTGNHMYTVDGRIKLNDTRDAVVSGNIIERIPDPTTGEYISGGAQIMCEFEQPEPLGAANLVISKNICRLPYQCTGTYQIRLVGCYGAVVTENILESDGWNNLAINIEPSLDDDDFVGLSEDNQGVQRSRAIVVSNNVCRGKLPGQIGISGIIENIPGPVHFSGNVGARRYVFYSLHGGRFSNNSTAAGDGAGLAVYWDGSHPILGEWLVTGETATNLAADSVLPHPVVVPDGLFGSLTAIHASANKTAPGGTSVRVQSSVNGSLVGSLVNAASGAGKRSGYGYWYNRTDNRIKPGDIVTVVADSYGAVGDDWDLRIRLSYVPDLRQRLLATTVASVTSQTELVLVAGSDEDDTYIGCSILIIDGSDNTTTFETVVSDWDAASKTLTLASTPSFTVAGSSGDTVWVFSVRRENYTEATGTPTTTTIPLSAGSAANDIYNGMFVRVGNEVREITDYVGSSKTLTLSSALATSPSPGDIIEIIR